MKTTTFILLIFVLSSCKLVVHRIVYNSRIFPNYATDSKINKFYNKHAETKSNYMAFTASNFVKKLKNLAGLLITGLFIILMVFNYAEKEIV